ncbi:flagellar motor switch protein FliM [Idiomarina sp. A28L]|uniref:flagellar motor switch protein FliM n=1 Tax=Idiomarina sp. A28L TaxID=1036674 RepID=UPI0002138C04|nr:flagellar motor switch protein FliM [Idiomarina sp. A28L]EGN75984.1 flagellar motor switch protein FliM [Idiomarina sp. A28L]
MAGDKPLSQHDIDELLGSVSKPMKPADDVNTSSRQERFGGIKERNAGERPFDPGTQHRVVRERLHTLEIINERFARQFRMNLFNLLRRNADISVESVRYQRFQDFSDKLPTPINLNIIAMKPLRGTALVVFPQNMVSMIVENLFGGDGRFITRNEMREFTGTEQRIINRVLNLAMDAYQEAWRAVFQLKISYIRSEMQPKFASITSSPSEIVVTTTFHLEVGNLDSSFQICMPYSMIEPLRDRLTNLRADASSATDKAWKERITQELQSSDVELTTNFLDIPVRLPQVMALKVGDVLPVSLPKVVTATVSGLPVLECEYGSLNKHRALRVIKILENHALASPNKADNVSAYGDATSEDYDDD